MKDRYAELTVYIIWGDLSFPIENYFYFYPVTCTKISSLSLRISFQFLKGKKSAYLAKSKESIGALETLSY